MPAIFTNWRIKPALCAVIRSGLLLLLLVCGCEDSDRRPLGSGHDFGPNHPDLYLAMGDSITSGEENPGPSYPQLLEGKLGQRVINRGHGGDKTYEGLQALDGALANYRPGFVLILYGVNDIIHGRSQDAALDNLRAMVVKARAAQSIPVIATLTPVGNRYSRYAEAVSTLNDGIRRMAREERVTLVDLESALGWNMAYMLEDGLHPNSEGNERIAAMFYNKLR